MEQWTDIRRRVLVGGVSKRRITRETGIHFKTLQKILTHSSPPGYRRKKPIQKPKIGPYLDRIRQIIESDKQQCRNQRHTAKRIWEILQQEGFTGRYTIVKDAVRQIKASGREVFMPLIHKPGEAQVDFGEAAVNMAGKLRKVVFFVMSLLHSDGFFVMAFDRECTETFGEGHVRAFDFFGFVPNTTRYDNARVQVAGIIGSRSRKLTQGFGQLVSHYLFEPTFCLVRRANEKGVVEGTVKYARLNFFVPVPQVKDFVELNRYLLECCGSDLKRRLRGKKLTKKELLEEDKVASLPLPATRFDTYRKGSSIASSQALVRFDNNDYSVPVDYAHQPIIIKANFEKVRLCHKQRVVAEHDRCWDKEQQIFNPLHYLRLIQYKPGSLDYARPLEDLKLPECFDTLRRILESRQEDGRREYIRVLRLLENHSICEVSKAIDKALHLQVHGRDAIAQFLIPHEPWEHTTFKLDGREHLRHVKIADNDVSVYSRLLGGGVA